MAFKSPTDLVTVTDREAELLIVDALRAAFPEHGIVSEESPPVPARSAYRWYVDPLDGTTNFAHGYPHCAVCVALEHEGDIVLGLVHDPLRRETFSAQRGAGAQLNGRAIGVSGVTDLGNALAATGFPSDRRERARHYAGYLEVALERTRCVRRERLGCARPVLRRLRAPRRLLGVAARALGHGGGPADRARKAGGRVTRFGGESHELTGTETAASNGHLHPALLEMLAAGGVR